MADIFCATPPQAHVQIPDLNVMDSFQLNLSPKDEHFGRSSSNQIRVNIPRIMEGGFTEHPLSHPILLEETEPVSQILSDTIIESFRL